MINEQDLDVQIRKALEAVDVPAGAREELLLALLNQGDNAERFADIESSSISDLETLVRLAEPTKSSVESGHFPPSTTRRLLSRTWLLTTSLALMLCLMFVFWPAKNNTRLDVLLAQYIESVENEPIAWKGNAPLPASLRGVLNQVVRLQPLGVADITPHGSSSRILVYAFRNHDGKQILLMELSNTLVGRGFGSQLTPLNTNTGGWSCAAADVQGSLIVLAVPGSRDYLIKHLRNISVT